MLRTDKPLLSFQEETAKLNLKQRHSLQTDLFARTESDKNMLTVTTSQPLHRINSNASSQSGGRTSNCGTRHNYIHNYTSSGSTNRGNKTTTSNSYGRSSYNFSTAEMMMGTNKNCRPRVSLNNPMFSGTAGAPRGPPSQAPPARSRLNSVEQIPSMYRPRRASELLLNRRPANLMDEQTPVVRQLVVDRNVR
ncbi:unnamed protein product, partial [Amoebophrya sp. A120]|eukprot:GSA120T00020948001.1